MVEDLATRPHPCSMTSAIAATSSSYSTTSLSELFTFLLQQKDRDNIHSSAEEMMHNSSSNIYNDYMYKKAKLNII